MASIIQEKEIIEVLLKNAKKEVKQIMEIAVVVKFIHEDNNAITSLCTAIESCLFHGLKKSSANFFKPVSTYSLLQKVSKKCEQAKSVLLMCEEYEKAYCNPTFLNNQNTNSHSTLSRKTSTETNNNKNETTVPVNNFSPMFYKGSICYKFLWIRLALINKLLSKIIEHIVKNSNMYYNTNALIADPVNGLIFSSLLIGPCTIEYTRMKICDYLWADQNADELIQRHRMQNTFNSIQFLNHQFSLNESELSHNMKSNKGAHNIMSPKLKLGLRASLMAKRKASINIFDDIISNNCQKINSPLSLNKQSKFDEFKTPQTPNSNRNFTNSESESNKSKPKLSQKFSTPLSLNKSQKSSCSESPQNSYNLLNIYKKNNYNVKDYVESLHQNTRSKLIYGKNNVIVSQREIELPGYLSLHLNSNGMVLKWTPNQMMSNGSTSSQEDSPQLPKSKFNIWDFSMHVDINSIVYLHCHQQEGDDRISIVLVAHDGVQYPPILFTKGSQFISFLTCFETGLGSNGCLDPSLLKNEEIDDYYKIFPQDRIDFVFQIISSSNSNLVVSTNLNDKMKEKRNSFSIFTTKNLIDETCLKQSSTFNDSSKFSSVFSSIFLSLKKEPNNKLNLNLIEKLTSPIAQDNKKNKNITPKYQNTSLISISDSNQSINKTPLNLSNIDTSTPTSICKNQIGNFMKIEKPLSVRNSLKVLCETMKKQILIRAFYGWLLYHRHLKTVGTHLVGLVNSSETNNCEKLSIEIQESIKNKIEKKFSEQLRTINESREDFQSKIDSDINDFDVIELESYINSNKKIDSEAWLKIIKAADEKSCYLEQIKIIFYKIVYLNGIDIDLKKQVWPFLLEHYTFDMNSKERDLKDTQNTFNYHNLISEWTRVEDKINLKEKIKLQNFKLNIPNEKTTENDSGISVNDMTNNLSSTSIISPKILRSKNLKLKIKKSSETSKLYYDMSEISLNNEVFSDESILNKKIKSTVKIRKSFSESDLCESNDLKYLAKSLVKQVIVQASNIIETQKANDIKNLKDNDITYVTTLESNLKRSESCFSLDFIPQNSTINSNFETRKKNNSFISQTSVDNKDLFECFAINMHRIDKDVTRCDRNYWYFSTNENLKKLKNIIYTYVWENLDIGYIQGMCDLVAPLLVILDDEPLVYSCFKLLMKRMSNNFPHGMAMDQNFSNMRALIQIMDSDLFEHMYHRGDYTHFYFSYRWFLLDFKREFIYEDVFVVWETIHAAKYVCTEHFYLFVALALVETYRDIILDNNMDFTDIIKFFNEMAEKHDFKSILKLARNLVIQLQSVVDNLSLYKNDE